MKISTSTSDLVDALGAVVRITSHRSAVTAYSGVVFEAKDGQIEMRATDAEVSLRLPLQGEVTEEGTVLVPARRLHDIVRTFKQGGVSLEHREATDDVHVRCGRADFSVRCLGLQDFPTLPPTDVQTADLPAAAFVDAVERTVFAASRDQARPILNGVYVEASGTSLTMTATDSYRCSLVTKTMEEDIGEGFAVNIPARALEEFGRLADGAETVAVGLAVNSVLLRAGDCVLTSSIIAGEFPNVRNIIPTEFAHEIEVPATDLASIVRRVSLMALKGNPIRIDVSEAEMTVSARSQDVGTGFESLDVSAPGEPFAAGCEPAYLEDGLTFAHADVVRFCVTDGVRPLMILAEGYQYLCMPVRLPDHAPATDAAVAV